jgi:hypothetical protein
MKDWLVDHLPESLIAAMLSVIGWWVQRKLARNDAFEARIAALERKTVTKDDFDELRESMNATFVNGGMQRLERRADQILFHMMKRDDL